MKSIENGKTSSAATLLAATIGDWKPPGRAQDPSPRPPSTGLTVVNNNDVMPGAPGARTFNSYNQPSVNLDGLVVFRARSRGGARLGQPTHGIYTRDMLVGGDRSSGSSTGPPRFLSPTTWTPPSSKPRPSRAST